MQEKFEVILLNDGSIIWLYEKKLWIFAEHNLKKRQMLNTNGKI